MIHYLGQRAKSDYLFSIEFVLITSVHCFMSPLIIETKYDLSENVFENVHLVSHILL